MAAFTEASQYLADMPFARAAALIRDYLRRTPVRSQSFGHPRCRSWGFSKHGWCGPTFSS